MVSNMSISTRANCDAILSFFVPHKPFLFLFHEYESLAYTIVNLTQVMFAV